MINLRNCILSESYPYFKYQNIVKNLELQLKAFASNPYRPDWI